MAFVLHSTRHRSVSGSASDAAAYGDQATGLPRGVTAQAYSRLMTLIAGVLGYGLDVLQALPPRGRAGAIVGGCLLLACWLWPELLMEAALLRVAPLLEAVTESVQEAGSRTQGR